MPTRQSPVRKRARRLVAVTVAILIAFPAGVWAADEFSDVPDGNTHHDAINAIKDAGVTLGCATGLYCPGDPVRRDQMASFMDRLGALSGQDPVVNAKTAQTADNATTADSATNADNATTADSATNADNADDADALQGLAPAQLAPISVVTSSDVDTGATDTGFAPLPGATTEITIPAGHQAIILARFTAESACYGGPASQEWCRVRILVDGTETNPEAPDPGNFAFDSTDTGTATAGSWEAHAMERSLGPLPAGTYTITVERLVTDPGVTFWLDDWHLVAEARLTP